MDPNSYCFQTFEHKKTSEKASYESVPETKHQFHPRSFPKRILELRLRPINQSRVNAKSKYIISVIPYSVSPILSGYTYGAEPNIRQVNDIYISVLA